MDIRDAKKAIQSGLRPFKCKFGDVKAGRLEFEIFDEKGNKIPLEAEVSSWAVRDNPGTIRHNVTVIREHLEAKGYHPSPWSPPA